MELELFLDLSIFPQTGVVSSVFGFVAFVAIHSISATEALQLQESSLVFDRCAECACITHLAGGHAHIEQPSGATSWREPMAQKWMLQSSCNLIIVAPCGYGLDIYKDGLFASSYNELSVTAQTCQHAANSHQSIAGTRTSDGSFLSKQSSEYPPPLASAIIIADALAPLIATGPELSSISAAMGQARFKSQTESPFGHEDGGGSCSKADWSIPPPNSSNLFKNILDEFFPELYAHDMPKRVLAHF